MQILVTLTDKISQICGDSWRTMQEFAFHSNGSNLRIPRRLQKFTALFISDKPFTHGNLGKSVPEDLP